MAPLPPRPTTSTAATRTGHHTQPDTWAAVASGTYHAPPPPPFDDSYLDVRASSFRTTWNFPQPSRTRFTTCRLRLTRSSAPSASRGIWRPTSGHHSVRRLFDNIFTLCDAVRQAFNTPAPRPWFLSRIPQAPRWHPHPQTDSSAGLNRQRRRDDPVSGRGKSNRTMTALTTDSDSGSDAPHGTDYGYWYIRQVSPRFYHAPDPDDGTGPPFPP